MAIDIAPGIVLAVLVLAGGILALIFGLAIIVELWWLIVLLPIAVGVYLLIDTPILKGHGSRGRLGRLGRDPVPVFGLLAPSPTLSCTENPRVVGSIPTLATTSDVS